VANGEQTRPIPPAAPVRGEGLNGRLDSWKEIACYLNRSERTVRRWEEREGLPVHRQLHDKRGSVYAYPDELRDWWESRRLHEAPQAEPPDRQVHDPKPDRARAGTASRDHSEISPPGPNGMPEADCASTTGERRRGPPPQPPRSRAALLIIVLLVVVGLLAVTFGGSLRESILRRSSPVRIRSLAVLPFENLSGDVEQASWSLCEPCSIRRRE
jgi:hypothetical protein